MENKFIKSTFILIIGGFITKLLGMVIKIITNRFLGLEGLGVYMLIMPTFMLLIAIVQMGFPIAISKLVSEDKYNNKNLIISTIPITLTINIIIMILLFLFSKYISNNLLHDGRCELALKYISFTLPFISISSILRGYFFGKEKMIVHVLSNIVEDIIRLITLVIGIPIFLKNGIESAVAFIIISNIISEVASIIVFILFFPRNMKIKKDDIKFNKDNIKKILSISIPSTLSRLIGTIGYFFEPIILTHFLLKSGYSNLYIVNEYGIINGYVMPLLLFPSFFTVAISQALIPTISKSYSNNDIKYTRKKIKEAIIFSLLVGIPATIIFILIPELPLKIIYNTDKGIKYIKVMAPFCLLYYFEAPLSSTLNAMGKAKDSMIATSIGIIVRTTLLIIGCSLKIGLWGFVISICINIISVTIYDYIKIKKYVKLT